ncbi:MAG: ATP-binding protein [Gaiellaceae bacterium]
MTTDGAGHVVRIDFPAKADYLLLARLALSGLARTLPLDEEEVADLKLAVTEACGNAVRHAYGGEDGSVGVSFLVGPTSLEMIVEDRGAGISEHDREEEAEPLEGGMGMAIIRVVVDEVDVRDGPDGRGTVVHMTKYLSNGD